MSKPTWQDLEEAIFSALRTSYEEGWDAAMEEPRDTALNAPSREREVAAFMERLKKESGR